MGIKYLSDGGPDGTAVFQSGETAAYLFGGSTALPLSAVSTVDSTTITTVDTTIATTGLTAEDTLDDIIEAQALAINRLIVDSRAQSVAINLLISRLSAAGFTS